MKNFLGWVIFWDSEKTNASQTHKDGAQFFSNVRPHQGNPDSHYLLACYYQERGNHREALKEFNKVLIIDPNYVKAYNGMGVSYDLLGDFSRAIEHYNYALKLDPNLGYVYNNLGYSFLLQGNLDNAITALKRATTINDQDQRFHNNLALAYGEKGQYDTALAEFNLAGDETKAHHNLAQVYFNKGLLNEAKSHYAIALKLNPSLTVVRTALKAADALTRIFEPMPSKAEPRKLVIPDKPAVKEKQIEKVAVVHQSPVEKSESVESISSTQSEPIILKQKELMATEQVGAINKVPEELVVSNLSNNVSEPLDFQKTDSGKNKILYELQVASFRFKENAIHAAISIQKLGYKADILSKDNGDNDRWYRLIMGPFETSDEVLTYKDKIAEKYKFNPLVLKTPKERSASEMISNLREMGEKHRLASLNGVGIEISNGNGAYRMAKKVGDYLKEKGLKVTRLTNANNFNHSGTKIFYQKEYNEAGEYVAEQLPVFWSKEETEKFDRPNIKIKILIGKDLVPHHKTFENGKKS
jgi:Flp pilus assembly protein TadD/cell division protein FtsN